MTELPKDFRPMLSGKIAEEADYKRLKYNLDPKFTYLASPKLDGIRVLFYPSEKIGACTRTLKPIRNKRLHSYIKSICLTVPDLLGLDGEITAGPPNKVTSPSIFNDTTRAIMSGEGDPRFTQYTFWVFDKFWSHNCDNFHKLPYSARLANIKAVLAKWSCDLPLTFVLLENTPIPNREALDQCEQAFVDQGYEGLMLRHPMREYKFGRSAITETQQHLIKLKRFEDAEATITGFEELRHNDNEATEDNFGLTERSSSKANLRPGNTLGKLKVKALTGDYEGVSFNIGTGFDQALRQEIWNNKEAYLDRVVKFKYQAIGSLDKPRIPVFLGFRGDE